MVRIITNLIWELKGKYQDTKQWNLFPSFHKPLAIQPAESH